MICSVHFAPDDFTRKFSFKDQSLPKAVKTRSHRSCSSAEISQCNITKKRYTSRGLAIHWISQEVKEVLLPSQINFILHYNDKIICQRNNIPVSSRITFQRTYANLLSHFLRVPIPEKFFFFQILINIFYVQITAKNKDFLTIYP